MKGSKVIFLALVMIAASACSKKSSHSNTNTVQTLQTEKLKVVESYSYTLESNGCSTETQVFSTLEEMCKGLQNNTLNNNCALELREDFFAKNCGSAEFVAFEDETKSNDKNYSAVVEQKKLKNGDIVVDFIKTTPIGTAKKASYVPFSCSTSIADAMELENGFTLLNGSKMLINRDQSKVARKYPQAIIECSDASAEQTSEVIDESVVKLVTVQTGHAVVEYATLSSEGNARNELTYISCSESKSEIMSSLTNGVNLLKGSKVLVRRDVSKDLAKGMKHPHEFSLVSCE